MISKHTKIDTLTDSGSQVNLISEQVVKDLGLELKPHPNPYHLGWVCEDSKLNVSHQCNLKFTITVGFVDEVKLNVVPLYICKIWVVHICLIEKLSSLGSIICIMYSRTRSNTL